MSVSRKIPAIKGDENNNHHLPCLISFYDTDKKETTGQCSWFRKDPSQAKSKRKTQRRRM